jgi:hypothetical protein
LRKNKKFFKEKAVIFGKGYAQREQSKEIIRFALFNPSQSVDKFAQTPSFPRNIVIPAQAGI